MAKKAIGVRLIFLLEGVREAEKLSVADFCPHFDMSIQAYYKLLRYAKYGKAATGGKTIAISITTLEKGLASLGYDAYFIIEKSE